MQEKTSAKDPFYRRTWLIVLAAVATLFLLLLVVLPHGISYGLQNWLRANGGESVQLEDIDFNVFTGRATVTNLNIAVDGQPRLIISKLGLDVDWMPLFSKHVTVKVLNFEDVDITILQTPEGSLRIGGISLPVAGDEVTETPAEPWGFGLEELKITNSSITWLSPQLQLVTRIESLALSHLVTWMTDPAQLLVAATVNDAPVILDGRLPPLSDGFGFKGKLSVTSLHLHPFAVLAESAVSGLGGQFSMSSELDVLLTPENSLTVSHAGVLGLDGLSLQQAGRQLSYAGLQWEGDVKLATALESGSLDLELQGTLAGKELGIADDDYQLKYAGQQWNGAITVNMAGGSGDTGVSLQGKLTGDDMAVLVPAEKLSLSHAGFLWEGDVAVVNGEATSVTSGGRLHISKLGADVADSKVNLVGIDALGIENLGLLENGNVMLAGVTITDAVFAKDAQGTAGEESKDGSVLSAGLITADTIEVVAGNQVAIGHLEWRDVISLIQRDSDGEWRPVRIVDTLPFTGTDAEQVPPATEANTEAPPGRVRVAELSITGDSAIVLEDSTVKPPFNMRLTLTEAVMKNIDNGQPGQNSPLSIKGRISKHSHISVQGTIQPFAARPTLDLKNHVDGISLPQLSAYTVDALGYGLESGHLDADSTLKINKGLIESENKLVIRGLELRAMNNASQEKLEKQLTVPLNTALNMLRDKHDTITLDLPVSGNVDSPDFDISDVVNTAVSKALRQGSMTYLKVALQPYGALITLAEMAGDAATRVRLQPVGFEPGSSIAAEGALGYLEKVAGVLKDRPEVNIKICGLAVADDRLALSEPAPATEKNPDAKAAKGSESVTDEQLLDLARARADFVKSHLIGKHAVNGSRLVACKPHIDSGEDDDQAPRVDLLI
jgi:hypothetical protein